MKKAIIGIISKHFDENKQRHNTYIRDEIKDAIIHSEVLGSDHCPIELDIF